MILSAGWVNGILHQTRIMNKEGKVIVLMVIALILLIFVIRALPSVITIILHPLRLLLFLSLLGIIIYLVKSWINEDQENYPDDLV